MPPRVLIIILCYNGIALTRACLQSLQQTAYPAYDILVIDNASHDDTPAIVRAEFPAVRVVETGANLGFAGGNNVGLRLALQQHYDYVLLLNNDTDVPPDMLERMVATAESHPRIGMVGPLISYYDAPETVWSAGGSIDWRRGTSAMLGLGTPRSSIAPGVRQVDFVTGCALLCKRAVLEQIGLLDERFFMYYEETEWCVRAARAGWKIMLAPDARLLHKIPLDARADKPYVAYYMTRNRLLFLRSTRAPVRSWLHALLVQDFRTLASMSLRPKWRHRRTHRNAMWQGWRDFARQRFGMQSV